MAEHDISLVTAKASGVVAENLKLSLATPSASITPATITAMVGLAKGKALQIAPSVTSALSGMSNAITKYGNVASPDYDANVANVLTTAHASLSTQSSKLMPSGNPAAFGQVVMQAQSHINDALELKTAASFISGAKFGDFGSGITNMSSLATQGLDGVMGDLGSAAKAMTAMGPLCDMTDMKNFGSSTGLINKLGSVKLGNASGVKDALTKAGVDPTRLNDPAYKTQIDNALSSINDPKVLNTVASQLKVNPFGGLPSYSGADASVNTAASKLLGG